MGDDYSRFNVRLETDTKNRWESYVEDSEEYNTMAEMVRVAVAAEINSDDDADDDDSDVSERLAGLEDAIQDLQETVEMQYAEPDPDEFGRPQPLADETEVFMALPDDGTPATPASVAERVGADRRAVLATLQLLARDSGRVNQEFDGDSGTYHFAKEV